MTDKTEKAGEKTSQDGRRDALKKMGRYAGYTAPALLALLATTRQAHAS